MDATAEHAEVLDCTIHRVWTLITCDGPPCCPNKWIIQASPTELVHVESWNHLNLIEGAFPGSHVRLARLPGTHRLLNAHVEGTPILREWSKDEIAIVPLLVEATEECQIIQIAELPPSVHETLGFD